jgi:hypothetical protein
MPQIIKKQLKNLGWKEALDRDPCKIHGLRLDV